MNLIIFKAKHKGSYIFIPLVIFRNCSKELMLRYCTNGIEFFPQAIETNKINAFTSTGLLHKFIERYDFEINKTDFVEVKVDRIEAWINNQEERIKDDNILNFYGIISRFCFFMQSNLINFDRLKLLQTLCEYENDKKIYDEFVDNCEAGYYSKEELISIKHDCPDRTEYERALQDPSLKNELEYLIEIFEKILLVHEA